MAAHLDVLTADPMVDLTAGLTADLMVDTMGVL